MMLYIFCNYANQLMKLLAIETATECCSAALLVNNEVHLQSEVAPRRHNELILDMCEKVLSEGQIGIADLDAVAFGRGPGAFTGIRLAASVAQGIALAQDLPVVSVSTLAALAYAAKGKSRQVLACIDARMREIYCALYECDENGMICLIGKEEVLKPEQLKIDIDDYCYGVGTGWSEYTDDLEKVLGKKIKYDQSALPQASAVVQLAKHYYEKGQTLKAYEALPVYLRDNVAVKKSI